MSGLDRKLVEHHLPIKPGYRPHRQAPRRIKPEIMVDVKAENRFSARELVWKVILPIGIKDNKYGKWSPNWEGPYRITRSAPGSAYFYETLEGEEFSRAVNGKFFKK
jgi:hypothetical protein